MTDIAELGLAVRSDGVSVAKDRLKSFSKEAGIADKAVAGLVGTIGSLVAAFSIFQIGSALIGKFVSSTIEAEKVQAQLAAVIKSTGNAAGYTIDQLNAMSKGLQQVTSFGDEAIGSAQALLLTFTKIGGEVFPAALAATLDLSTAMGTDLNSAAIQVGKALNDPIAGLSALSRVGIQFTQDQKQMIKGFVDAGDAAGAQNVILKELQRQFGDSAKAARGTLGGALKALQEAFGDLFEATGPQSEALRKSIERMVEAITDPKFIASVQNLGVALFDAFANALPVIIEIINKVSRFFQEMDAAANDPSLKNIRSHGENTTAVLARKLSQSKFDMGGGMNQKDIFASYTTPAVDPTSIAGSGPRATLGPTEEQIAAGEKAAKAYDDLIERTNARIQSLNDEAAAIGMSTTSAMEFNNQNSLMAEVLKANIEVTPQVEEKVRLLAASLTDAQLSLEGLNITMENRTPWEEMSKQVEYLNDLLQKGKISANDYASGIGKAAEEMVSSYANGANDVLGNVEKLTDALGLEGKKAFDVQKALGIARAVVSGAESVTHSFNAGSAIGGPPLGFVFAGIAAAATAAQIAALASTTYSSKTVPTTGAGSATSAPAQQEQQQRQGVVINLQGKPSDQTTLGDVGNIFSKMNDWLDMQGMQFVVRYKDGS